MTNLITDSDFLNAIQELYSISEKAVASSASSKEALTIYRLPLEFLEIFLDIPGRRAGFCVISSSKLVVFFDEDPNLITVIGKVRNKEQGHSQITSKAVQLFKISFDVIEGGFKYKDNTGGALDPGDIVDLVIKWSVS